MSDQERKVFAKSVFDGIEGEDKIKAIVENIANQYPNMSIFWDDEEKEVELIDEHVIIIIAPNKE